MPSPGRCTFFFSARSLAAQAHYTQHASAASFSLTTTGEHAVRGTVTAALPHRDDNMLYTDPKFLTAPFTSWKDLEPALHRHVDF